MIIFGCAFFFLLVWHIQKGYQIIMTGDTLGVSSMLSNVFFSSLHLNNFVTPSITTSCAHWTRFMAIIFFYYSSSSTSFLCLLFQRFDERICRGFLKLMQSVKNVKGKTVYDIVCGQKLLHFIEKSRMWLPHFVQITVVTVYDFLNFIKIASNCYGRLIELQPLKNYTVRISMLML